MAGKVRIATRDLAERDRVPFVRDFYGRTILGLDMAPLVDADFDIDMSVVQLDGLGVAHGSISPLTATRTSALMADGNSNILMGMCDSDFMMADAYGDTQVISAGEILLMPLDQKFAWTFPEAGMTTAIHIDRAALISRFPRFEPKGIHRLNTRVPGADLLFSYARALHKSESVTNEAASLASRQLLDLAAFVIAEANNTDEIGAAASVREERFRAVKRDVARHFHEPSLSIHDVAARQDVTPRYLQRLFDENGTTFTTHLQNMRLEFARARLVNAKSPVRILDVALEAGFTDLSTFNRLFRKRFAVTPSSFRRDRLEAAPAGAAA